MWQGFFQLKETIMSHRRLKYLLILPFLLALTLGSYKMGHLSAARNSERMEPENPALVRARRSVEYPLKNSNHSNVVLVLKQGGAIYTRWGRTECPTGADSVYSGIAGGSEHTQHGGGSNYLCLPTDPIWGTYNGAVEKGSKLYGAEYQNPSGFDLSNVDGNQLHDHNVPCVVCQSQTRSSVLMIPARNLCYSDWNLEYSGYLMAENSGHHGRTQFVCMDKSPEADPAGFRDENGALFYNVEGVCGSLPCPPYIQRREITCAVCTK